MGPNDIGHHELCPQFNNASTEGCCCTALYSLQAHPKRSRAEELMNKIARAVHEGYNTRTDYPAFATNLPEDRKRWLEYIRQVGIDTLEREL